MRKILQFFIRPLSRWVLAKYNPQIIGVTGSVGKTSARDAIYAVLANKYVARENIQNYNNEIGLPLSILGLKSPGRSIIGWVEVFAKAIWLILFRDKNYPEILILEMGVDRPGDMTYLTSIAKPHIGVLTMIGQSHAEHFGEVTEIQKEKSLLLEGLEEKGWAIVNFDNDLSRDVLGKVKASVITYGCNEGADVRAGELVFRFEKEEDVNNLRGLSYQLHYKDQKIHISLPEVVGYPSVYASLAGVAVGLSYGLSLQEIADGLKEMRTPKGRTNLIHGVKNSMIIDDTYNSSPQSSALALDILAKIPVKSPGRKIVAFGDMLELGVYSHEEHLNLGKIIAEKKFDWLVTVGDRSKDIVVGAERAGYSNSNMRNFPDSVSAGKFLKDMVGAEDVILAKGSRGMKMDLLVREIMKEPEKANELLVGDYSQSYNQSQQL